MEEVTNAQFCLPDEKGSTKETTIKKEWVKPVFKILNINSGGGTMPDGPDTRAPFPTS